MGNISCPPPPASLPQGGGGGGEIPHWPLRQRLWHAAETLHIIPELFHENTGLLARAHTHADSRTGCADLGAQTASISVGVCLLRQTHAHTHSHTHVFICLCLQCIYI